MHIYILNVIKFLKTRKIWKIFKNLKYSTIFKSIKTTILNLIVKIHFYCEFGMITRYSLYMHN